MNTFCFCLEKWNGPVDVVSERSELASRLDGSRSGADKSLPASGSSSQVCWVLRTRPVLPLPSCKAESCPLKTCQRLISETPSGQEKLPVTLWFSVVLQQLRLSCSSQQRMGAIRSSLLLRSEMNEVFVSLCTGTPRCLACPYLLLFSYTFSFIFSVSQRVNILFKKKNKGMIVL